MQYACIKEYIVNIIVLLEITN